MVRRPVTHHPASADLYGVAPAGARSSLIETSDGVTLRFAHWPAEGAVRGAVLLAQGRTEYIEKAYEWIAALQARGFHVGAFDFRGQGLSQRMLGNRRAGYVRDFAEFQHDYDAAYQAFRGVVGDTPMVVVGHSMGGLATARFVSRRQSELAGAILSAPMLGLGLSPAMGWAAFIVSNLATISGFGACYAQGCDDRSGPERGFADNVLTHDPVRFARHEKMLAEHPDLTLGGTTYAWLRAGYREMGRVARLPDGWLSVPALVVSASEDTVVSNDAIAAFVEANPLVQRVHLEGSRHEPLMEVDAVQTVLWSAIDGFLDRVAPR